LINNIGIFQFWDYLLIRSGSHHPQAFCHNSVSDCIWTKECNKLSVDVRSWKLLLVENCLNRALIHSAWWYHMVHKYILQSHMLSYELRVL
jgi:hypothetical protein